MLPCHALPPALGDDVHHRTGIAAVFRTELVGDQHVLLHKLRVLNEKAWTADAVIVVVLTVNLLIVVATPQTVYCKSLSAVGVREALSRADVTPGTNKARLSSPSFS